MKMDAQLQQGEPHILWPFSERFTAWLNDAIDCRRVWDGHSVICDSEADMRVLIARARKAGFTIRTFDGFDVDPPAPNPYFPEMIGGTI